MLQRIRTEQIYATSNVYDDFSDQLYGMTIPFIQQVTPTNGQTLFTVNTAYETGTGQLKVFLNGQLIEKDGWYTETSSTQVTFLSPRYNDDVVIFRIEGAGGGATTSDTHIHVTGYTPQGLVNGNNSIFTLSYYPKATALYLDGIRQGSSHYTITGNTLTLDEAPSTGVEIMMDLLV